VQIWAYCLLPNRVHLIAIPDKAASLGRAIGEAHRAEATAKWARSWGGAATRQESFATTLAYHPVEMISLAARGQHSRSEDPFSVTTEANLNCSVQF